MAESKILIGSHIGMSAPNYFLGSVKEALTYNETTFMFYTGAPQNFNRVPVEKCKIDEGIKLLNENNISTNDLIIHAPYIINLGNSIDETKFLFSVKATKIEVERCAAFNVKNLVLHPGSHVGSGTEIGLNQVIKGLDLVLESDTNDVTICLETMAGKGSEVGKTFEEIAYIINNVKRNERLGVCLDTCHINDAGYDVNDINNVLNEFDKIIGLDRLKVIHLNNSKNPINSHKDRHANIKDGTIPFETLKKYVFHDKLKNVPKILETPYVDGKPPYKEEIEMLLK